jgi:hypothetical protein
MILSPILRFIRLKWYQFTVTFAIYMLNPVEQFVVGECKMDVLMVVLDRMKGTANILVSVSIMMLALGMLTVAITLYLPQHCLDIANRAWFYYAGEELKLSSMLSAGSSVGGGYLGREL